MLPSTSDVLQLVVRHGQDHRLLRVKSPLDSELLLAHRLQGTEALSRPFVLRADLLSPNAHLELKQLIGQPMRFSMDAPSLGERHFHGYVREFSRVGSDGGWVRYEAEVVPWFAFLEHTANCRLFQDLSIIDIVERVFADYGPLAQYRMDLAAASYPKLPYCVQYNESDFAFVSRLLEDAGIYYRFEHGEAQHTMVLADDSLACQPICEDPCVPFHAAEGSDGEVVDTWFARRKLGASLHATKSYDFKQPATPLAAEFGVDVPHGVLPPLRSYTYEGAARYASTSRGEVLVGLRAQEAAWTMKTFQGEGNARGMSPGRYFELTDHFEHDAEEAEQRQFLLLEVKHDVQNNFLPDYSAAEGLGYRCALTSLRRKIVYRPQRLTRQPRMPGPQTATVVGPPGEELWADDYGRVKVQFHWDRAGYNDHRSSCWVRVASPWAGEGMGGVSIPRVGQEVIVDFLDGNPDRPIITGRVYNAHNMPPFGLEVSGMRSKTVRGEGYNELSMHDGAGKQQLNMHAQRDMNTTVQNDQTSNVNNSKTTTVANNHTESIGVDQTLKVGNNQALTVGAHRTEAITGNDTRTVNGNDARVVVGTSTSSVTGAVSQTYQAGQARTITAGGYMENITGDYGSALKGNYLQTTTGTYSEAIDGAVSKVLKAGRSVTVTGTDHRFVTGAVEDGNEGPRTLTVTGEMTHTVTGKHTLFSDGDMALASSSKVDVGVGEAGITINGSSVVITAGGSTIKVDAGGVTVNGAKISLNC